MCTVGLATVTIACPTDLHLSVRTERQQDAALSDRTGKFSDLTVSEKGYVPLIVMTLPSGNVLSDGA